MQLLGLQLIHFKNYAEASLDLSAKINVLVGKNGSGKTNLLDAIHYLSLTRSAFSSDQFSIRHGESSCLIKGTFVKAGITQEVSCSLTPGRKIFREGTEEYQKLSDHVGRYPVVLIAPDDTELVKEGSEERRKFFDSMIAQCDRAYLEALIHYTHALKQRNSLLKMFAINNTFDPVALETYDNVLANSGAVIFEKRKNFLAEFRPLFDEHYKLIVDNEPADVEYRSALHEQGMLEGLEASRQRDVILQRTTFGIHRDDFHFMFGWSDLKRLGSQGQKKSFVIALKLTQFAVLKNHLNVKPILLLDDIFDKLDDLRIRRLLHLIKEERLGQLFITDARLDRTVALLSEIDSLAAIFTVENGHIAPS